MSQIIFDKLHGLGNDYIYIDLDKYPLADIAQFARQYSDRRKGIGGDGVITYHRQPSGHYMMRIFNLDGSEGLMCGNAIRCVAKLLYERGLDRSNPMTIETQSGDKILVLTIEGEEVTAARVDMGLPRVLEVGKRVQGIEGSYISVGNPHFIHFIESDPDDYPLAEIGPKVEHDAAFPDGVNYEVAMIQDPNTIKMRVWERGSGLTQACGTGATATAVAAINLGLVAHKVKVEMPGGSLVIEWSGKESDPVYMTGPATYVYQGIVTI